MATSYMFLKRFVFKDGGFILSTLSTQNFGDDCFMALFFSNGAKSLYEMT